MDLLYQDITRHLVSSGKRLLRRTGKIKDIGVLKKDLTEEDVRIERELTRMIVARHPSHRIYAEEEHAEFTDADDLWVIDPISGTSAFIAGMPHYALVITHVRKGVPVFAAVYDPSVNELFTAEIGGGAFLNGQKIRVSEGMKSIVINLWKQQEGKPASDWAWSIARGFSTYKNPSSFAVNYCWVAAGRYDGFVAITKDVFPEYAGSLIVREAGGMFTNCERSLISGPENRFFIGGNPLIHPKLLGKAKKLISKSTSVLSSAEILKMRDWMYADMQRELGFFEGGGSMGNHLVAMALLCYIDAAGGVLNGNYDNARRNFTSFLERMMDGYPTGYTADEAYEELRCKIVHAYFARSATVYAVESGSAGGIGIYRPLHQHADTGSGEMHWAIAVKDLFACFHRTFDALLVERGLISEEEMLQSDLDVKMVGRLGI